VTLAVAVVAVGVAGCEGRDSSAEAGVADSQVVERQPEAPADTPLVAMETSSGRIVIELYPWLAPASVDNFLRYVEDGFYDGLIFHRVMPEFVIQAGGYDADLNQRQPRAPIRNESDNGLTNARGTIAMARFPDPHSATSQFYVNVFDNRQLDYRGGPEGWGYAVFGRVRGGVDVVDSISMVNTGTVGGMADVPVEPVVIDSVRVLSD
jgi:cyclophilin family peptidyl-prolyl cis-trans isomerase